MTNYIDTHIHLDLLNNPEKQLEEAGKSGVGAWIVPGLSSERWPDVMALAEKHVAVYAAPGVHPRQSDQWQKSQLEELSRLLGHPKAVALGEVGLDRQAECSWPRQEEVFVQMIQLALDVDKPMLIHARRSTDRILELLRQEGAGRVRGIFHAFSGSLEIARKIINSGFALGIGGVVTFPEARRLPEVVRMVPAEALVLETDAPDMTPEPYRGQLNRPAYLGLIAEQVAALRGWSLEETARVTTANACRILGLSQSSPDGPCEGTNHEQP